MSQTNDPVNKDDALTVDSNAAATPPADAPELAIGAGAGGPITIDPTAEEDGGGSSSGGRSAL